MAQKNINDMLNHVNDDIQNHFYESFHSKPIMTQQSEWSKEIGWHHRHIIHLKNGWTVENKEKTFLVYFNETQLLNWNGKYIPCDMGITFTLGTNL